MTLLTDKKKSREKALNQNAAVLRRAAAAIADRDSTPANVLLIGDSITEGEYSTVVTQRWASIFRDSLRAEFPTVGVRGGKGFIPPYRDSPSMPQPSTLSAALSKGGNGQGLGFRMSVLVNVADTQKFSVTSVTSVDVVYAKIGSGGGAFTIAYSSDAGSTWSSESGAVSCDGSGTFTDMLYSRVALPRRGDYIIRLTCSTANAQIGGIVEYDGDEGTVASEGSTGKGLRFYEAGHYGSTTTQHAANAYMTRQARIVAPALVVIALATNDYAASVDPATSKTNLQTIITNVRTGCTQAGIAAPSIVLFAFNQRTGSFTYPWSTFVDKMHEIAAADDHVTVCDLTQRLAAISDNTLGMFQDAVHPNRKGHAYYAAALTQFVVDGMALRGPQKHSNESHSAPLALALPATGYKAGAYYGNTGSVASTRKPGVGNLEVAPFVVHGGWSITFDQIGAAMTVLGAAGCKVRFGIYADSGFGYPGALVYDSGQQAADTGTPTVAITVSTTQTLAPGLYWIGGVPQAVTAGSEPTFQATTGKGQNVPVPRQNLTAGSGAPCAVQATSVTGALPDPFPTTLSAVGTVIDVMLRAA